MELMTFFATPVYDAVEEWQEHFPSFAKKKGLAKDGTWSDDDRSELLNILRDQWFLNFEGWRAEEVLVYLFKTYPRKELVRITSKGLTSAFLQQVHDDWKPRFIDWMHVLWRFSGCSHEFFADILFLLPDSQRVSDAETGRVLFRELIWQKILPESACPSLAGALIQWPMESTLGMSHATQIYHLAKELSPEETGLMCRSLVMFRAMRDCTCGYGINEVKCNCGKMELLYDYDQPYVTVLFQKILADHGPSKVIVEDRWDEKKESEFLRSACEYVFSEPAYKEIVHNTLRGKKATVEQRYPRPLTSIEQKYKKKGGDLQSHMVDHKVCVHPNCPQMIKTGCMNLCCKTHCASIGMANCQTHRMYTPRGLPTYLQRRNVETGTYRKNIPRGIAIHNHKKNIEKGS